MSERFSRRSDNQSCIRTPTVLATVTPLSLLADVKLCDECVTRTTASNAMMGRDIASIPATRRRPNRLRADRQRWSSVAVMSITLLGAHGALFQLVGEV